MFQGCGTALETPLLAARLDEERYHVLVREQVEAGVDFIVTGLPSADGERLPAADLRKAVEIAVREARGKVPVLASTWGRLTSAVIACVRECEALGADGVLCPPPAGASQTHIRDHFEILASSSSIPVVIDNMAPGIAPVALPVIVHLANNPGVIGVREHGACIEKLLALMQQLPDRFAVLSGTDSNAVTLISMGGSGVISAAANQIPGKVARMIRMSIGGNFAGACGVQRQCRSQLLQADLRWSGSTAAFS